MALHVSRRDEAIIAAALAGAMRRESSRQRDETRLAREVMRRQWAAAREARTAAERRRDSPA